MHRTVRFTLANGLRAVAISRPHMHRSVVAAYVHVGSRYETPGTNGLSHFLEHMLFRGTRRHPTGAELNDAIERVGGNLAAETHGDYTVFDLAVPPEGIETACELLGSIFREPSFAHLEVEKGIVREEILGSLDGDHCEINPDNLSRSQVFGRHPLGFPIAGTLENIDGFTVYDLRRHLREYYRAGNIVVAVCSRLPLEQLQRAVELGFAGLRSGTPAPPPDALVTQQRARVRMFENGGAQTMVRVAFPTPGSASHHARAVDVLLRVLDDGMSTRLHRRICDELGLAYEVNASVEMFRDVGVAELVTSVAHSSVGRVVREMLALVGDLATTGPTRAELERAKHRMVFDLAAIDDDARALADFYATAVLADDTRDPAARRREILALTVDDVRRAARMVFCPSRANIVAVGTIEPSVRAEVTAALRSFRRHARFAPTRIPSAARAVPPFRVQPSRRVAALDSRIARS